MCQHILKYEKDYEVLEATKSRVLQYRSQVESITKSSEIVPSIIAKLQVINEKLQREYNLPIELGDEHTGGSNENDDIMKADKYFEHEHTGGSNENDYIMKADEYFEHAKKLHSTKQKDDNMEALKFCARALNMYLKMSSEPSNYQTAEAKEMAITQCMPKVILFFDIATENVANKIMSGEVATNEFIAKAKNFIQNGVLEDGKENHAKAFELYLESLIMYRHAVQFQNEQIDKEMIKREILQLICHMDVHCCTLNLGLIALTKLRVLIMMLQKDGFLPTNLNDILSDDGKYMVIVYGFLNGLLDSMHHSNVYFLTYYIEERLDELWESGGRKTGKEKEKIIGKCTPYVRMQIEYFYTDLKIYWEIFKGESVVNYHDGNKRILDELEDYIEKAKSNESAGNIEKAFVWDKNALFLYYALVKSEKQNGVKEAFKSEVAICIQRTEKLFVKVADDIKPSDLTDYSVLKEVLRKELALPLTIAEEMKTNVGPIQLFNSTELNGIIDNYCSGKKLLGKGASGEVYRGVTKDNEHVAIKIYVECEEEHKRQFINEVDILSRTNHKNIVKLIGCCAEEDKPAIISEFISNGDLSHLIFEGSNIGFSTRLQIAIGCAEALAYLHTFPDKPIVHGDLKPENILLTDNFAPKLVDFGISKLLIDKYKIYTTTVVGTDGYIDPSYLFFGEVTTKCDIFSYGVILVELITMKRARERNTLFREFADAHRAGPNSIMDMIDEQIKNEVDGKLILDIASVAIKCLKLERDERPNIEQVLIELQKVSAALALTKPA